MTASFTAYIDESGAGLQALLYGLLQPDSPASLMLLGLRGIDVAQVVMEDNSNK